jgi:hypothetical protein
VSLTAELANPRSPLSRFMTAHLPGETLHAVYGAAVRSLPVTIRPPEAVGTIPWTTLGTAVDYRIRLWLGSAEFPAVTSAIAALRAPEHFAFPTPGAAAKFFPHRNAAAAGDLLMERLRARAVSCRPLTPAEEADTARWAVLAARYDAIHRAPHPHRARAIGYFTELRLGEDADHALHRLCTDVPLSQVRDICQQMHAAQIALAGLRGAPLTSGPTFAGSARVGEAEGDFIAGGCLIDVKATITPELNPAQARKWFRQLAGYLLLDFDDAHAIEAVGLYLSRQAILLTWPVTDFLRLMGAALPLYALRHRLNAALPATAKDAAL